MSPMMSNYYYSAYCGKKCFTSKCVGQRGRRKKYIEVLKASATIKNTRTYYLCRLDCKHFTWKGKNYGCLMGKMIRIGEWE